MIPSGDKKMEVELDYDPENPRCDQEQLDRLKRCSNAKDMSEWNEWRENNPNVKIYLQNYPIKNLDLKGIDLSNVHVEGSKLKNINLEDADLSGAHFENAIFKNVCCSKNTKTQGAHFEGTAFKKFIGIFGKVPICSYEQLKILIKCSNDKNITEWNNYSQNREIYLQNANLTEFYLKNINLDFAHLEGAVLRSSDLDHANLEFADLSYSNLNDAKLMEADISCTIFKHASLYGANLENAKAMAIETENGKEEVTDFSDAYLRLVNFSKVNLWGVNLERAILWYSILEGTAITGNDKKLNANLKGADFTGASVSGKTIILKCDIDEKTNFSAVNLDSARVEPKLLTTLKTNIRRISWRDYYDEKGKILTLPIRFFWWLSDYGSSSVRIGLSILIAILFFTDVYLVLGKILLEIFTLPDHQKLLVGSPFHDYIRVLCFAISTMVTLGFGGINIKIVSAHNWLSTGAFGLVTLNLISGYLFLSVLVTRFGILFQSQAPEQKTKETNNAFLYCVAFILFTIGLDIIYINNKITHTINNFYFGFLIGMFNTIAAYFIIYLFSLSIKTIFLFFKKISPLIRNMNRLEQ